MLNDPCNANPTARLAAPTIAHVGLAQRVRRQHREVTTRMTQAYYFHDERWKDRSATDLIREYLDRLEPIVAEVEMRFMA